MGSVQVHPSSHSREFHLAFEYAVGCKKSADNSFRATHLQYPPGVLVGNTNVGYPTFTIEVAKTNESEPQLLSDAATKHFSPMTGVVVWLGIKIYPTHLFSVTLLERDIQRGFGALQPLAYTGFLNTVGPV
jgi:hypothetical protein